MCVFPLVIGLANNNTNCNEDNWVTKEFDANNIN